MTNCRQWMAWVGVAGLAWGAMCGSPARGEMILVDFGNLAERHSVGAPDANGNWWDYITGATDNNLDLVNTLGNATTIDLQMAGFTGPNSWNGALTPNPALNGGLFAFEAVTDDGIFFTDVQTPSMTLSGLDPSLTYSLTFFGSRVTSITRTTTYAVGAANQTLTTSGLAIGSDGNNWNDNTVVTLSGLSAPAGQIVVNLTATGGFGYINALEIEYIPEPGSFGLLALGALLVRRLRRRG